MTRRDLPSPFIVSPTAPMDVRSPANPGLPGNAQQVPVTSDPNQQRRWIRWMTGNPEGTVVSIVFNPADFAWLRGELTFPLPTAGGPVTVLQQANTYRNLLQLRNASPPASPFTDIVFVSFGKPASTDSLLRLGENDQVNYTRGCPQDMVSAYGINANLTTPSTTARITLAFSNVPAFTGPDF